MDSIVVKSAGELRLETLKLSIDFHYSLQDSVPTDDGILATAQKWSDFVVGPAPKASLRSAMPKGRDDP